MPSEPSDAARVVIAGAGIGGLEALIALRRQAPAHCGVATTLVTHEAAPLAAFGATVSRAVARVLRDAGVDVLAARRAMVISDEAMIAGSRWLACERMVALPRMVGPRPHGVPADDHGFVPVGVHGEILGLADAYAVGDGAAHPVKQGGLAAQQADAAACSGEPGSTGGPLGPSRCCGAFCTHRTDRCTSRRRSGTAAPARARGPPGDPCGAPGRVVSRWASSYLDDRIAARAAGL